MFRNALGRYAVTGIRAINVRRVFGWLWRSWLQAEREVPLLRWLALASAATASLVAYLAAKQGQGALEIAVFGLAPVLFGLILSLIIYLLFAIYSRHRSDAIFDSRRLSDLIRKLAQEEIRIHEDFVTTPKNLFSREDRGEGPSF